MNKIKVLFFATLRDRAGIRSLDMDIPADLTVQGLKDMIVRTRPGLADSMKSVLVTINREYVFDEAVIPEGGEVALFPPVSGG